VIASLALAAQSAAQTSTAGMSDDSRFYAGVTFGATFGHKSSGAVGVEAGGQLAGPVGIFVEGGRMMNVGTQSLDDRAATIANAVGATASASYKANYFAVGLRIAPDFALHFRPYLVIGGGLAQVRAETALAVNGTTVPPESLGVQFGSDLNGTEKKGYFTIGGGVLYPITNRFFVDGSYRYGRIGKKTSEIENDEGINTQRLQLGVGVRF
jgi:opacity protein-like surface antigen